VGLWIVSVLLAVLTAALSLAMRAVSRGDRAFVAGNVTCVSGAKGSGKTLFLVHEMLRAAGKPARCVVCDVATMNRLERPLRRHERTRHPVTVASNVVLHRLDEQQRKYFRVVRGWADVVAGGTEAGVSPLPHCTLVVLDELHVWSPADQTYRLPSEVKRYLSQLRHAGHELLWCSQNEDRVALSVRKLTDWIAYVRLSYFRWRVVRFAEFDDASLLRRSLQASRFGAKNQFRPTWSYRYRVSVQLGLAYNTHSSVSFETEGDAPAGAPAHAERRPALNGSLVPLSTLVTATGAEATRVMRDHGRQTTE